MILNIWRIFIESNSLQNNFLIKKIFKENGNLQPTLSINSIF